MKVDNFKELKSIIDNVKKEDFNMNMMPINFTKDYNLEGLKEMIEGAIYCGLDYIPSMSIKNGKRYGSYDPVLNDGFEWKTGKAGLFSKLKLNNGIHTKVKDFKVSQIIMYYEINNIDVLKNTCEINTTISFKFLNNDVRKTGMEALKMLYQCKGYKVKEDRLWSKDNYLFIECENEAQFFNELKNIIDFLNA